MKTQKHNLGFVQPARKDWVAVGDSARFILFEKRKGNPLTSIKTFLNEEAHQKVSDFERDQPGRSFDSFTKSRGSHQSGTPRHSYTSQQDPKDHSVESFVQEVSAFLDDSYGKRSFDRLILIANNRLLGKLRAHLDEKTQDAISAEHPKNLAWINGKELEERVLDLMLLQ